MPRRRQFLHASAAVIASGAWPVLADERGGIQAPRIALVIGNGSYKSTPLQNPVNDARAIAQTLGELGFQCQSVLNASLQGMSEAIKTYTETLARQKAVGLFYYAGHGAQLAWRNYLIPVDANIVSLEDIPRQALELNGLLAALKKAANPMNVIILDACRDNPFGSGVPLEQKGLSQFDAPIGSLLSYATAPGNAASDGEGANGLFTESLLREMRVPGAKLEDVFKRVRLNVRLKSRGQQVPWESTSLEEDFYFSRPAVTDAAGAQAASAGPFEQELALWNSVKDASSVAPLTDYLNRYPNGRFSQLAQVQLDRLLRQQGEKKVAAVSAAENPFSNGTVAAVGRYAVGDSYAFELRDGISNVVQRRFRDVVTSVSDAQVVFNDGELVLDLTGNEVKSRHMRILSPAQLFPAEYAVGVKWSSEFGWLKTNGSPGVMALDFKVVGREPFKTPAGSFHAFKVIGSGRVKDGAYWTMTYWIDPDQCPRPLQFDMLMRASSRAGIEFDRTVLVSQSTRGSRS